jgi:hypothetical protein
MPSENAEKGHRIVEQGESLWLVTDDHINELTVEAAIEALSASGTHQLRRSTCQLSDKLKSVLTVVMKKPTDNIAMLVHIGDEPHSTRCAAPRWLKGTHRAVYEYLLRPSQTTFEQHPASTAVKTFAAMGGDLNRMQACLYLLGDIAPLYAKFQTSKHTLQRIAASSVLVPSKETGLQLAETYVRSKKDPPEHWLTAIAGGPRKLLSQHPLFGPPIVMSDDPYEAIFAVWRSSVQLLIAQWLSVEYHPELMNEHDFSDSELSAVTHLTYGTVHDDLDKRPGDPSV